MSHPRNVEGPRGRVGGREIQRAAGVSTNHSSPPRPVIPVRREDVARFLDNAARRIMIELLDEACAAFWERRATAWDHVDPATALACRNKAAFIRMYGDEWPSVEIDPAVWPNPDATGLDALGNVA